MTMQSLGNYGREFQSRVLYALLTDKQFLQNLSDLLVEDYFDSTTHKWIVNITLQYFKKYHTNPSMEVMATERKKVKNNDVLKLSIKEELRQVYTGTVDDVEYVKEEFLNFCRNQEMKKAILQSVDLMESGEYESIRKLVDTALKAGEPRDVGLILSKDIETRYRESEDVLVPLPWERLNEITDGGLPPGSLMVIMGGTGSGKSTMACHIALHAAKLGFNVTYYTLELSSPYVGKKIDSVMTGIDMKQLKHNRELIEELNGQVPGQIIIKEFYPGRSSMDNIEAHQRNQSNNMEIETHLIVIDYPELLRPRKSRKDSFEESNDIYTDIKGYAKETGKRIVAPSQLNRGGMKQDIVEHDGIAGSVGKIFIGDFVLTVSRKRADKLHNTARWHILKSRLGLDGMSYSVHMDLTHNKIEILGDYDPEEDTAAAEEMQEEVKAKLKKQVFSKM